MQDDKRRWKRILVFVAFAGVLLCIEPFLQAWLVPTYVAELTVRQLDPSETSAASRRVFETVRGWLPTISIAALVLVGAALFIPNSEERKIVK